MNEGMRPFVVIKPLSKPITKPTQRTVISIKKADTPVIINNVNMYAHIGIIEEMDKSISPDIRSKPMPKVTIANSGINLIKAWRFRGSRKTWFGLAKMKKRRKEKNMIILMYLREIRGFWSKFVIV
jgi:hypothetical protein